VTDQPKLTLSPGNAIACHAKCYPCRFGEHGTLQHTWMDDDDREHAGVPIGAAAVEHPCGCHCNTANVGGAL
jgi:hypothetical protein